MDKQNRKAIIAGNWKMNKTATEAAELIDALIPAVKDAGCEVVICVPFTDLVTAVAKTKGTNIHVGAENVHFEKSGAFTGEISADMLTDLGVEYVVVGHSERRQYFAETDETVNKRAKAALAGGLKPIICVGESLTQREQGVTEELIRMQVKIALNGVTADELKNVVIAYEPIWAIGTGKTATADQAEEVCAAIRKVVGELYGADAAKALTVQYGGVQHDLYRKNSPLPETGSIPAAKPPEPTHRGHGHHRDAKGAKHFQKHKTNKVKVSSLEELQALARQKMTGEEE